jgi:integrase
VKRRKNPFPGVRKNIVKGRIYWKFERGDFRTNIPGPYGSLEFLAAYEAALAGSKAPHASTALAGTLCWLIEQYLGSLRFQNLSDSRKRTIRLELDWLREQAGKYQFERLEVRHVEALMSKKNGPTAANTVKKNLSMLFNFAAKKLGYTGPNPARHAERMKTNPDGFHTWTDAEVNRFLERHGPGTKARLVMLLALNTGMSRQDLCQSGRHNLDGDLIAYRRGKTGEWAYIQLLGSLAVELASIRDRLLFVTHGADNRPYKPETLGNWFRDRCKEAGVPGSLHGLRKAGATRLANEGADPREIMTFLGHANEHLGAVYTKKQDRRKAAQRSGYRLKMSNLSEKLDRRKGKDDM